MLCVDELDVTSCEPCERRDVIDIRRDDLIAVDGQHNQGRINDILAPGPGEEFAGRTSEHVGERADVDTTESPRQHRLAWARSAPHLADDSAMREWHVMREQRRLETTPHRPVVALERDQRSAVQDERHAALRDFRAPVRFAVGRRTTTADSRSARVCAAISRSVITPKSAS